MKLINAIVHDDDASRVMEELSCVPKVTVAKALQP